jgi:hypothetical protein
MNIILGNSIRLPLRTHLQIIPARPYVFSETKTTVSSTPPSTHEPAGSLTAGSPRRKSDTQMFCQRAFGLNLQLYPPSPSALAD